MSLSFGALSFLQFLLLGGNFAVEQAGCIRQVTLTLCHFGTRTQLIDFTLEIAHAVQTGLFGFPASVERIQLFFLIGHVFAQRRQAFFRRRVGLVLEGQFFHSQTVYGAAQLVDFLGGRVDLHAQARCGLIHQVDRLIGQLT